MSTTTEAGRLTLACAYQTRLCRPFAERYQAALRLLLRGYTRDKDAVRFPSGITANASACTCQDGIYLECLHKLAARQLAIADRFTPPTFMWRAASFGRVRKVSADEAALWDN
jgi:hypothetical protein